MISAEEPSLSDPEEDIVAPTLGLYLSETDRNKNTTKTRYTNLGGSGGLYITKFHNKRKVLGENGLETESGVATPPGGAARGGPVPQGGVSHPGSVSVPLSLRSFSCWIKTAKI